MSRSRSRSQITALAEWRGYREPRVLPDRVVSVADAVTVSLQKLGLGDRLKESEILAAWKDIVGDFLAMHSAPKRLIQGVLHVHVLQPSVHFDLERHWKAKILEKLTARFGKKNIREVRFRIGG
jgi:hypothetical protein